MTVQLTTGKTPAPRSQLVATVIVRIANIECFATGSNKLCLLRDGQVRNILSFEEPQTCWPRYIQKKGKHPMRYPDARCPITSCAFSDLRVDKSSLHALNISE